MANHELPTLLRRADEKDEKEPFLNQLRLFYAAAAGDPVNAKSLLEAKADVNYKDHNGRTALHGVPRKKDGWFRCLQYERFTWQKTCGVSKAAVEEL